MGHVARSIPLISYLLQTQCQIFIAATPEQRKLLESEFNSLEYIQIEGYNVRYGEKKSKFIFITACTVTTTIPGDTPGTDLVEEQMKIHRFDAVISDNRYGLYHPGTRSVFITHQLAIISGWGSLADRILRQLHYRFIQKFDICWVPDVKGSASLSGSLGHPEVLPHSTVYLGPLSRMENIPPTEALDLLIILSGPEPQRTILEAIILPQLQHFNGSWLLVRGLPSEQTVPLPNTVHYLGVAGMNQAMANAKMVITRSGYTSIMDLVKLHKKAILIPTPGQTEQEYLARHMKTEGIFMMADQQSFNLEVELNKASRFPFKTPDLDFLQYQSVLTLFVQSLP